MGVTVIKELFQNGANCLAVMMHDAGVRLVPHLEAGARDPHTEVQVLTRDARCIEFSSALKSGTPESRVRCGEERMEQSAFFRR